MKKFALILLLTLTVAALLLYAAGCDSAKDPDPAGNGGEPTSDGEDSKNPPAANVEGDLRELIAKIYETYRERTDIKAYLAELDGINDRISEITALIYSPDNELSEAEIAELNEEMEGLQPRKNELSKYQLPFTMEEDLTPEGTQFNPNVAYFIGADDIPFTIGVVSEAAFGAVPYSLVMIRMEAGANVEAAKTKIKNGADPWKWVCVGVDPGDVVVDSIGDLVILIIAKNSKELQAEFLKLAP